MSGSSSGTSRHKIARCVALLRDGPLTVPGAAEMLGIHPVSVAEYFNVLRDAGVARVSQKRKNPHGRPTNIWEFIPAEEIQ